MPQQGSGHAQQLPLAGAQVPAALREHGIQATLGSNIHTLSTLITSEAHPCKYVVEQELCMLSMDMRAQRHTKTRGKNGGICTRAVKTGQWEHAREGLDKSRVHATCKAWTVSASPACCRAPQMSASLPAWPKGSRFDRTVPEKITGSCEQSQSLF